MQRSRGYWDRSHELRKMPLLLHSGTSRLSSGQLEIQNRLPFSVVSPSGSETTPSELAEHSMAGRGQDCDALARLGATSTSRYDCRQGAGGFQNLILASSFKSSSYHGRFVTRCRRLKLDTSARYSSDGWDMADTQTRRASKTLVRTHGIPKHPLRLSIWENEKTPMAT